MRSGDILREEVQAGSELGRVAKATMDAGNLVGDDVIIGIVRHRLCRPDAQRGFVLDENAAGSSRSAINRQTLVSGNASRPTTAGDFSLSVFPTGRLTLVNNTAVYTTRISGDAAYNQFDNSLASDQIVFFQFLGIRTIINSTDINYRISPGVGVYGGYHYSDRQIRSIEALRFPAFPAPSRLKSARNCPNPAGGSSFQLSKRKFPTADDGFNSWIVPPTVSV